MKRHCQSELVILLIIDDIKFMKLKKDIIKPKTNEAQEKDTMLKKGNMMDSDMKKNMKTNYKTRNEKRLLCKK